MQKKKKKKEKTRTHQKTKKNSFAYVEQNEHNFQVCDTIIALFSVNFTVSAWSVMGTLELSFPKLNYEILNIKVALKVLHKLNFSQLIYFSHSG